MADTITPLSAPTLTTPAPTLAPATPTLAAPSTSADAKSFPLDALLNVGVQVASTVGAARRASLYFEKHEIKRMPNVLLMRKEQHTQIELPTHILHLPLPKHQIR